MTAGDRDMLCCNDSQTPDLRNGPGARCLTFTIKSEGKLWNNNITDEIIRLLVLQHIRLGLESVSLCHITVARTVQYPY